MNISLQDSTEVAIIDDADFEWLSKYHWRLKTNEAGQKFAVAKISSIERRMCRLIAAPDWSFHVEHLNGNTLDCRRENLKATPR